MLTLVGFKQQRNSCSFKGLGPLGVTQACRPLCCDQGLLERYAHCASAPELAVLVTVE